MRKLGVLGIALIGLVFLLEAVNYLVQWFFLLSSGFHLPAMFLGVVPSLVYAAAGVFVLMRRSRLAESWFPESESPLTVTAPDLARVGIALIGMFLFIRAVPTLVSQISAPFVNLAINSDPDVGYGTSDVVREMISSVPQYLGTVASFALGWFLIARSEKLAERLLGSGQGDDAADVEQAPDADSPSAD